MWKEAFVAYLPGGTEKNHENLSQDGWTFGPFLSETALLCETRRPRYL
jgi:hypothetical protein